MLKIKDNVDLKELEKYGFRHIKYKDLCYYYQKCNKDDIIFKIFIFKDKHIEIKISIGYFIGYVNDSNISLDKIYDLIKADLVEKVEE